MKCNTVTSILSENINVYYLNNMSSVLYKMILDLQDTY